MGSDGGPRGSAAEGQVGSLWRTGGRASVWLVGQDEQGGGAGLALTLESPSELYWKLRESRGVICSLFDIFVA